MDTKHFVLDDSVAERERGRLFYRFRTSEWLPVYFGFASAALGLLLFYVPLYKAEDAFSVAATFGAVFIGAICYWFSFAIAYLFRCEDLLAPLTTKSEITALGNIADEHPPVARFIEEAVLKGNTLRVRDLYAAVKMKQGLDRKACSEQASKAAAEALTELNSKYSHASPDESKS